jgi:hypothetical protein
MRWAKASAVMTPGDQATEKLEAPFSVRRRERGGRSILQVSSSVSAIADAKSSLDDWALDS